MPSPLVIIGKPGSGKTTNAQALLKFFKRSSILDEWDGQTELAPGTLALTNIKRDDIKVPAAYPVITIDEALSRMKGN